MSDLLSWIALRRVCGGRITTFDSVYFDHGRSVPSYLPDTLDCLRRAGLITLDDTDECGLRQAAPTVGGCAPFVELGAKRGAAS